MHDPAADASIQRQRQEQLAVGIGRAAGDEAGDPVPAMVVRAVSVAGIAYPTAAKSVYAVKRVVVTVDGESIGALVTLTVTGDWFCAINTGNSIPPANTSGAERIARLIDGLYQFQY